MNLDLTQLRDDVLATELRGRGWRVSKDDGTGWETPSSFARRHGMHPGSLCRIMNSQTIPGLELHRANGGKGRLVMVRASTTTENWMECRKKLAPVDTRL